jgi:hypothetical protein
LELVKRMTASFFYLKMALTALSPKVSTSAAEARAMMANNTMDRFFM